MKKALMNASVASMIYKFNMDNIGILESMGYQVDVACNFGKENPITPKEIEHFKSLLNEKGILFFETNCPRKIFAVGSMIKTYKQLKNIIDTGEYDLIHTQSPIGGVICRLAARKAREKGTKVVYTAHGFHFYKGAPKRNWLIYYPIEKFFSRWNDLLITINKEDYERAKNKFHTKAIEKVPGVGLDLSKFYFDICGREKIRNEIGCKETDVLLVSVGELNKNKNHKVILKALAKVKNPRVIYAIVGKGDSEEGLRDLAIELGVKERVVFLGFRDDIRAICSAADIFCFPSLREGLGMVALEAMACGRPLITSNVHGINDYSVNGITGFSVEPNDVGTYADRIEILSNDVELRKQIGQKNIEIVKAFSLDASMERMREIYRKVLDV